MTNRNFKRKFISFGLALTLLVMPLVAAAQTSVKLSKNKYKVQDDVELG